MKYLWKEIKKKVPHLLGPVRRSRSETAHTACCNINCYKSNIPAAVVGLFSRGVSFEVSFFLNGDMKYQSGWPDVRLIITGLLRSRSGGQLLEELSSRQRKRHVNPWDGMATGHDVLRASSGIHTGGPCARPIPQGIRVSSGKRKQ